MFGLVVVLIGVLSLCACKEAEEPELSEMDEFIAGFKAKHPDGYQLSDGWYEETYYRNGTMELFDQIKRKFVGYCSFTDSDKSIPDFVSFKTNDFEYWTLEGYYWRNDKQIERHSNLKRGNYYWWETKYDYSLDTSFQFTVTKAPTLFTNKISGCFGYFNFLDEYNYLPEIIAHPTRYSSSHPFNELCLFLCFCSFSSSNRNRHKRENRKAGEQSLRLFFCLSLRSAYARALCPIIPARLSVHACYTR